MSARAILASVIPGKSDDAVRLFRENVVPEIKKQPGFVSIAIYIDRDTNRAQTFIIWESKEALEATAKRSEYLRKVVGLLRSCLVNATSARGRSDTSSKPDPWGDERDDLE